MWQVIKGILIVGGIIGIYIGSYFIITNIVSPPDNAGTFGDTFGAVNALFSAFGIIGILYSISQQQKEIKRQEIDIANQNNELKLQRFETIFFNLLNNHFMIRDQISSLGYGSGLPAIFNISSYLNSYVKAYYQEKTKENFSSYTNRLEFDKLAVTPYIKSSKCLYKIIKESKLQDEQKYFTIWAAYLTQEEIDMLGHYLTLEEDYKYSAEMFRTLGITMSYRNEIEDFFASK